MPQGEQGLLTSLLVGGLALTALSVRLLWATPHPITNLVLVLIALCLFLMGLLPEDVPFVRRTAIHLFSSMASFFEVSPIQAVILLMGLHVSVASWSASGGGALTHVPEGGCLWVLGIALTVLALWKRPTEGPRTRPSRLHLYLWALILAVALAARLLAIANVPSAVSGDEGSVGLVGWEFVSGLRNNILSTSWHSLPSLYLGLVSISQRLFGHTLEAIRLPSVLGGALSIVALYWAANKLFGRAPALLSSAFLAIYHVHVLFSRIATPDVWDGVFFSAALGGLWAGAVKGERAGFLLAGFAAGAAHFFQPISRFILLYALAWALMLLPRIRSERRLSGLWAGGLVAFVTLLPLALCFFSKPLDYGAPIRAASITGDVPLLSAISENPEETLPLLSAQLQAGVLGIFVRPLEGVYAPGTPLLLPLPAALLALGLILAIMRSHDFRFAALLIAFAGPLLIGTVSIEAPNVELLQALAPAAAMLIALPLTEVLAWATRLGEREHLAARALVIVTVMLSAGLEIRHTLSERPPFATYAGPTAALAWQMGEFLAREPEGTPAYLFGWPRIEFAWEPGLAYLAARLETHDLVWPLQPGQSLPPPGTSAVLLFVSEQMGALEEARGLYPDARIFLHSDPIRGLSFTSMEVGP
jgi:4-amino-4-deoxy-L-arabinose transferase-like glycosyltransferase